MQTRRHPDQMQAARQSDSLAALAVTLLLVVVGLYLVDMLSRDSQIQDCVLSGRSLCDFASLP